MHEKQLKYLLAIAQKGHIQGAAEELYITPASLRSALHRMEKELGVCLFTRQEERLVPTAQGEIVLRYGRRLLSTTDRLKQALAQEHLRQIHRVGLSFCNSTYIEGWLLPFLLAHPQIILQQKLLEQDALYAALFHEETDLGIDRWEKDIAGLSAQVLLEDTYLAVVPPDHPLSCQASVSVAQLCNLPVLCLPPCRDTTRITEKIFRQAGYIPNIVYEGGRAMLHRMFAEKKGIFFTSKQMTYIQNRFYPSTQQNVNRQVYLPISDPGCTFSLALFWKKDRQLSNLAQQLQQHIINQYPIWSQTKEQTT